MDKVINGDTGDLTEPLHHANSKDKSKCINNGANSNINSTNLSDSGFSEGTEDNKGLTVGNGKVANGKLTPNGGQQSRLHETIQMERIRLKSRGNHFFSDGKRRVDYVLVHMKTNQIKTNDESIAAKSRNVFESNLREEGLELEYADDIGGYGYVFAKIYTPWHVMTRYAEVMKLKMPMKTIQTSWKMLFDEDEDHAMRFTAAYSRDKDYLFDIPPQKEQFFSTAQRAQVVEFILKRKSFSPNLNDANEFGISKLLNDNIYIAAYPLHEGYNTACSKLHF
ncbi:unnamed protein product [Oppiella nova]|uniref:Anoctamin dimerisation domain-containing protein n=1 Tax=Oppiella nova TaxID=334625 RepID=A0A7R9QQS3_9ACAR|nr:unnamed protein product [Oppiella nova]CAG2172170.1 unnamed protein product [Oppiella nova]